MFNWLKSRAPEVDGVDEQALLKQINDYIDESCKGNTYYADKKPKESSSGRQLLDYSPEQLIMVLYLVMDCYAGKHKKSKLSGLGLSHSNHDHCRSDALQQLAIQIMRRKLPYSESDLVALLKQANDHWSAFTWYRPHNALLGILERTYPDQPLPEAIASEVRRTLKKIKAHATYYTSDNEDRKMAERARRLLGESTAGSFKPDFAWSKAILKQVDSLSADDKSRWQSMLALAQTAEASSPNRKWQAAAKEGVEQVGEQAYAETVCRWLALVQEEKADTLPLSDDVNATIMRGLIWGLAQVSPQLVARDIKLMALYCFRKVPDFGAVSTKVGNACLYVLGQLPGMDSVSMLSELLLKIKYPSARRLVEKALEAAAKRNQMSREDLMEIAVPDYGLDSQGQFQQPMGEYTAVIHIEPQQSVSLVWQKPDGKTQKSVPAAVSEAHAGTIKQLKKTVKDIRTSLQSESARIEKCFLKPSAWTYTQWCERYRDHPLLQHITHKLIWQFSSNGNRQSAMWLDGQLCDEHGQPISESMEACEVRLWHPVHAGVDEVLAWRNLVSDREITQPFKQAHREVYIVTDAERATEQYSNRFAAHILKQHQLNALCQQRGWQYYLQGNFDSHNVPSLELPQWNTTVEFYVDGVEQSVNQMGIFNYVSSDQVRFAQDGEIQRVEDVEPLVFSEVMRDVDLFVGVCSIGNDPNWNDNGILENLNEYWHNYSFGELMETARTRKDVLARLLPKLKIAAQCEITDRFLVVRGEYRTYKIHLGSGNILMEPNDQYLCIVEGRSKNNSDTRGLVLPFEGDHRMAVILSKAFLLANDKKITDSTILSQIKRR